MSTIRLEVHLAPYLKEKVTRLIKEYEGRQDNYLMRAELEADVSYRLQTLLGVPPGTFIVTAVSLEEPYV
jgi:hypothetical protein